MNEEKKRQFKTVYKKHKRRINVHKPVLEFETVSLKEIAQNGYNLSPSFWINKKQNEIKHD